MLTCFTFRPKLASRVAGFGHPVAVGQAWRTIASFQWFFRNRETGAVTIAQTPNLVLWVVIAAGVLLWVSPSSGNLTVALEILFKGGLLIWAADELFRGVNPWRRCVGAAVLGYEFTTIL
jgi:hypothetical protein